MQGHIEGMNLTKDTKVCDQTLMPVLPLPALYDGERRNIYLP